jgi:PilZ domain
LSSNERDRRQSPRVNATLQARLEFSVLLRDPESKERGVQHLRACAGHTVNISENGLAFVVRAKEIEEKYLAGSEGSMSIEIDLPSGASVEIEATPVWFEHHDEGYLVGARFSRIGERERDLLREFLRELGG